MFLQRYIGGTKHLRLAVVGAPSSGKTYLLSDLIHSLHAMGCEAEKLPLNYPYSSFGSFFYEVSNFRTDDSEQRRQQQTLRQTEAYACRPENHYGGILRLPGSQQRVAIDFVNIPGEVFNDNSSHDHQGAQNRLMYFFMLRDAIERLDDAFAVVAYENPAHRRVLIIEPSDKAIQTLGISLQVDYNGPRASLRQTNYMDWPQIYRELRDTKYERGKKQSITGRQLMQRFTEFMPDSFLCTLHALWNIVAARDHLDHADMEAHDVFRFFYFLLYCQQATDIIICDKLFLPDETEANMFNFDNMTQTISQYFRPDSTHRPNVYLAFRSADMLMRQVSTQQHLAALTQGLPPHEGRNRAYQAFVDALSRRLAQSASASPSGRTEGGAIDSDFAERRTMTGSPIADHIRTRVGTNMGYGFWHLLMAAYPRPSISHPLGFLELLKRRIRHQVPPLKAYEQQRLLPPQTYFTATPVDEHLRIYHNDPDDPTQFIWHGSDDTLHSFHIEQARCGTRSFCFGSYQLMCDIFRLNGLDLPTTKGTAKDVTAHKPH